jgi:hypothetical protein
MGAQDPNPYKERNMRDATTDKMQETLTYSCNTMWNDEPELQVEFMVEEGLAFSPQYQSDGHPQTTMCVPTMHGVMYCYYVDSKQKWGAKY